MNSPRSILSLLLFVQVLMVVSTAHPAPFLPDLVIVGPGKSIKLQVEFMKRNWSDQMAIAVVQGISATECSASKEDLESCTVEVHPTDLIYVRWLKGDGPGSQFRVYYYWRKKDNTAFAWQQNERYIVFLAPTHGANVFTSTMLLKASEENISEVRGEIQKLFP